MQESPLVASLSTLESHGRQWVDSSDIDPNGVPYTRFRRPTGDRHTKNANTCFGEVNRKEWPTISKACFSN